MPDHPRRNARLAAIALCLGALSQVPGTANAALNAPWAYAGWLVFVFGALGLCEELGAARPLNRAGLLLLATAWFARSAMLLGSDPAMMVRGALTFALSSLLAMLLWSVALMHRRSMARMSGLAGAVMSGGGVTLMLAAHLAVGGGGYLGFQAMFWALHDPAMGTDAAMSSLSILLVLWSLAVGALLWTRDINQPA